MATGRFVFARVNTNNSTVGSNGTKSARARFSCQDVDLAFEIAFNTASSQVLVILTKERSSDFVLHRLKGPVITNFRSPYADFPGNGHCRFRCSSIKCRR